MNKKQPDYDDEDRLDPELAALFSESNNSPLESNAFIHGVLEKIQRARRRRLLGHMSCTVVALTAGAFAAPFVGERTFALVDWLTQNTSATGIAPAFPLTCALGALITWRIARRAHH